MLPSDTKWPTIKAIIAIQNRMDTNKKDNLTDLVQALSELETKPAQQKPAGTVLNESGEVITLGQDASKTK